MNYTIESYEPESGRIRVAYSSTEEIVSVYSFDVHFPNGQMPDEETLDRLIRSRTPVWRLSASVHGDSGTSFLTTLELGAHANPLGTRQTLDGCKAAKIAQIRMFRDAMLCADIPVPGSGYQAKLIHANLLTAIVSLESMGLRGHGPLQWPTQGGQLVDISIEDAKDILQSVVQQASRVFKTAVQKEEAVNSAETEWDVAAITWTEPGRNGGVLPGNIFVMSGPCHQTFETEIEVDRVVVQ